MWLRDQLLAGFAVFHLVVVTVAGVGPVTEWMETPLEPAALIWNDFRKGMWDNVTHRYGDQLGPRMNSWHMFAGVSTSNVSTHLEVRLGKGNNWRVVYAAERPERAWRRSRFRQYRWRELLGEVGQKNTHPRVVSNFLQWFADEIGREREDVCAVRLRVRLTKTPSPEKLARGVKSRYRRLLRERKPVQIRPCK